VARIGESRHYSAVARQIDLDAVESIVQVIAQHPDGATIEQIARVIDRWRGRRHEPASG
jgi:hypothetical protein